MNKNLKLIILALVFIVLLVGAALLYNTLSGSVGTQQLATQPTLSDPTEGDTKPARNPAPNVELTDWNGNTCQLSDFIGKPVILNFWASWCTPCKSEMPEFDAAYQEYGDEIHFLMVNCTTSSRETKASAVALITQEGYRFPVYFDTTGEASSIYGAYSIPLTYFINADGELVAYAQGAIDAETLQTGINMIYEP